MSDERLFDDSSLHFLSLPLLPPLCLCCLGRKSGLSGIEPYVATWQKKEERSDQRRLTDDLLPRPGLLCRSEEGINLS